MSIQCPHQLLINGEFVNSSWGRTYNTINPTDESVSYCNIYCCAMITYYLQVICTVESSSKDDVDKAVRAAKVCVCIVSCLYLVCVL